MKFTPYEKHSKKEQKRVNSAKRGTWGEISPISRKAESKKVYNRKNRRIDPCGFDFVSLSAFQLLCRCSDGIRQDCSCRQDVLRF